MSHCVAGVDKGRRALSVAPYDEPLHPGWVATAGKQADDLDIGAELLLAARAPSRTDCPSRFCAAPCGGHRSSTLSKNPEATGGAWWEDLRLFENSARRKPHPYSARLTVPEVSPPAGVIAEETAAD